jgi:hypothetical protein
MNLHQKLSQRISYLKHSDIDNTSHKELLEALIDYVEDLEVILENLEKRITNLEYIEADRPPIG